MTRFRRRRALAVFAAILVGFVAAAPSLLSRFIEVRLRGAAAARGYEATWSRLTLRFPAVTLEHLRVAHPGGDALLAVDSVEVSLRLRSLFLLKAHPERVRLARAVVRAGGATAREDVDPDSLDSALPPEPPPLGHVAPRAADAGIRAAADALIRLLLIPALDLPELDLSDVTFATGAEENGPRSIHVATLRLRHLQGRTRGAHSTLEAAGHVRLQRDLPFSFGLSYDRSDRVHGRVRLGIPDPILETIETLDITLDGTFSQHRREGAVSIGDSTIISIGDIPVRIAGRLARKGPRIRLELAADSLTATRLRSGVPRPVLGPLLELEIAGAWDQRLAFDLDLAAPDSVRFDADVIPRGMRLGSSGSLDLHTLDQPFTAHIKLPKHRVDRDLSPDNPHFRPLAAMDSNLVHAVVTNEDGAFYRHGGFNMDAVRQSIAENARAGGFRRGAGTITMQLVRNLYLGHERTLSRKGQEVALAWIVEHLTPATKERLLEIYLNIIEWGPGVHGADEATHFYFGHDASRVTPDEALFLSTVVPSPSKWMWRLERDGSLRPGTRAQMHFIGRRMIDKGWLEPDALPPADSLRIELLGPARNLLLPVIAIVTEPVSGSGESGAALPGAPIVDRPDSLP